MKSTLAAAAMAIVLTSLSANAGVIVSENFGGSGSGGLSGTAADTFNSGITSAGGSATWVANSGFKDNGAVNVDRKSAYLKMGSYINNAKGTTNGLFELTLTVSQTTGAWLSLGFGQETAPSTDKDFTNSGTGTTATYGLGTIIYRAQGASPAGELDMYGGTGTSNAVDGPDLNTGNRTLTVILDLTPVGGYNGTTRCGRVTWSDSVLGVLGSYTFTTNRSFSSILITGGAISTGTISRLTLSQGLETEIVPVAWKHSNAVSTNRPAGNLSKSTGMNAAQTYLYNLDGSISGEPITADGVEWATSGIATGGINSNAAAGKVWIVADLGASYELSNIKIWNFQWKSGTNNYSDRGISQFDVFVRDTALDTTTGLTDGAAINLNNTSYNQDVSLASVFNQGTLRKWRLVLSNQALAKGPNTDTYAGQSYSLSGAGGRFVAIRADSYYGGSSAGLGKVRIQTAPVGPPKPTNCETNVALSTRLTWGKRRADLSYDVYFGTVSNSLVFKGNQKSNTYNPVGLVEGTKYYWRIDGRDTYTNVYTGAVWTFTTYNTSVMRQQILAKYDNEGVPYVLGNQKLPGYDTANDPKNILAGQINGADGNFATNAFNQRNIGAIYPLAFCYVNTNSIHYRSTNVLYRILLALDYSCRAQGGNGGFNEKYDFWNGQLGWCGVTLPNGGNSTRTDGASTVMGFPFFCIGRAIVMLKNEPAFITALDTVNIDNDGNGTVDVNRRTAYKYMFDNNINGGTMTGIIQCMMTGKCKGGHPNQDIGALAAIQACNEAYQFLNNGTPYLTPTQLNSHRDLVLFNRGWFSSKNMILEVGHGAAGYDTGYANTIPYLLGSYARHINDSVAGNFITSFMEGYQKFFVMDDAWPDGGYWEYRTARRQGDCMMPMLSSGISQSYHSGYALIYDKTLSICASDPWPFLNKPWSGGLESSEMGELLNHWSTPVDTDYVLPCNRAETFTHSDSGANLEVVKTGASPTTVTWKAFNYDGATKTYTYQNP